MAMPDPNTCGANFTEEELENLSYGIGADGMPFQRYANVTDTGDDFFSCGQDPATFEEKQLYGLYNGKIMKRVSIYNA